MGNKKNGDGGIGFPSTHWSEIRRASLFDARAGGAPGDSAFLGALVRRYYPALKAHLVVFKRIPEAQAEDILHDFLEKKFLERNVLAQADPARGRFRTFILTALDRYLVSRYREAVAQKRSPGVLADLEECAGSALARPSDGTFDHAWARQILEEALRRMRRECDASGRGDLWGLFEARVLAPCLEGADPLPYEEMVARFHLPSPSAAYNLLLTAKRMYVRNLKSVVAEYTASDTQAEDELEALRAILMEAPREDSSGGAAQEAPAFGV